MSFLIDTCVISEFVKIKPDENVKNWYNDQKETQVFLSVISLAEIKKGIYKIKPTQPESREIHCQNLTVATRNVNDFKSLPINVVNPFEVM